MRLKKWLSKDEMRIDDLLLEKFGKTYTNKILLNGLSELADSVKNLIEAERRPIENGDFIAGLLLYLFTYKAYLLLKKYENNETNKLGCIVYKNLISQLNPDSFTFLETKDDDSFDSPMLQIIASILKQCYGFKEEIEPSLKEFIRKTINYIKDTELRINDLVDIDMVYNDLIFILQEVLENVLPYKYKYRVNPLKVNKAQKVIHSYSKAVEKRSGLIEDVKLLPHPVSKIKNALKIGIAACILNDTPGLCYNSGHDDKIEA